MHNPHMPISSTMEMNNDQCVSILHKKRSLLSITDLSASEVEQIIQDAFQYKDEYDHHVPHEKILAEKTISLVFEKPSLRTRLAFEVASTSLGAHPVFQTGVEIFRRSDGVEREKIGDIGRVLERYSHAIIARVFDHHSLRQLAEAVSLPIINALCDQHHPTQALADLMAIRWHKAGTKDVKVCYLGDGNNVATSLMHICTMMGIHFVYSAPPAYTIPFEEWSIGQAYAKKNNTLCEYIANPAKAIHEADVVYTDTFVSMGDEGETEQRLKIFTPYQVTSDLMKCAKEDAIFLHCLPAHRGEEVTASVIDSVQSKVFDLAECRMHVAKAILKFFLS